MPIDYNARLERVRAKMDELGVELMYLPQSANLQWLMGIKRDKPSYTYVTYPGGWLNGAFIGLNKGPILTVPRMVADFDLGRIPGMDMRVLPDRRDRARDPVRDRLPALPPGRRRALFPNVSVHHQPWSREGDDRREGPEQPS